MVSGKSLDYGFNGYQVPHIPRATRSARRSSFKKKAEDNQLCAFDLLATVAGNLLLENGSSPTFNNASTYKYQNAIVERTAKKEQGEDAPLKVRPSDIASERLSQANHNSSSEEFPLPQNDVHLGFASVTSNSDLSRSSVTDKLVVDKGKNKMRSSASKLGVGLAGYRKAMDCGLEDDIKVHKKDTPVKTGKMPIGIRADMCSLEDPEVCDGKPAALVSSDSSAKASVFKDHIARGSLAPSRGDVKLVSRDDDENSSGCTHPRAATRSSRPPPCHGDRRIRRLMASRCWKSAPKLKDECNTDKDIKPIYRTRKNCYKGQRTQRIYPFKKRKFLYDSLASNSVRRISSSEGVYDSPKKGINLTASGPDSKMHGAIGTSSSVAGERSSFQSRDSHVKVKIKSFRVPELFIEMPETATVGSLKRTVMEAITAILGDDLHVGVILQGKKVRDDNKTLLQTGITRNNLMDALGFTLEPNPLQTPPSLCPADSPFLLPCDIPQHLTRYSPSSTEAHQGTDDSSPKTHTAKVSNFVQSDHDSAPSPTDMLIDESNSTDSKALVAVPAASVEALAMVPVHCKSKRSEIAQRRIRRPFSVTEVEALVQAVEKLGTGRWRDVKLCAFDNAKHRTYVDLKDKWKTLVHTARISPQQRRGEPVPQELLDRVLTAHAYWSQQQLKQQPEICFLV